MSKKKTNPRRIPATMADIKKAKQDAIEEAVGSALAIFLTVMRDKEGWGIKRLQRLWGEIGDLSDSLSLGYVDIKDLKRTLAEEAGIIIAKEAPKSL